jgi:hypothetical protein
MNQNDLQPLLERLRGEVTKAGTLTPESRQLLRQLADEIDTALQTGGAAPGAHPAEHKQRLANLLAHFEADHPGLAATLREVTHALGQVGL